MGAELAPFFHAIRFFTHCEKLFSCTGNLRSVFDSHMALHQITLYHKKTGEPVYSYPASVQEWLSSGEYTLEAPDNAKEFVQPKKLPSAGREANRDNPVVSRGPSLNAETVAEMASLEPILTATEEVQGMPESEQAMQPKRAEPRRRPKAD